MTGQVVGITTLYLKGGENLNFAIPINDAKHLLLTDSKVHDFPNETEPQAKHRSAPSSTASQGSTSTWTGQCGGIVHNNTASLSAEFWIIINNGGRAVTGCMGLLQPLFGSGLLTGFAQGTDVTFVVTSAIGWITFVGQRHDAEISGTYTVERQESPDQLGTFTLHRAKSEGLPAGFDVANCPTDAEVHK